MPFASATSLHFPTSLVPQGGRRGRAELTKSKHQAREKSQPPSSGTRCRAIVLALGIWTFFGAWILVSVVFTHISAPPSDRPSPLVLQEASTPATRPKQGRAKCQQMFLGHLPPRQRVDWPGCGPSHARPRFPSARRSAR